MIKTYLTIALICTGFLCRAQLPSDSLALWLRSDAGVVTSGSNVTQWTDQSGKGRNAVPTLSSFPQYVSNVRFNSNTGLSTPAFQTFANKRGTMFVVTKCTGGSGTFGFGTIVSTYVGAGVQWQTGVYASTASYAWYDGTGSSNISITSSPINQWGIVTYDRNVNDSLRLFKSGVLAGKLHIANNQPASNVFLIGYNSFSEFLNGDIAEIIVYNRSLSEAEIYQVNTYLANKYCFNSSIAAPAAANQHRCGPGTVTLVATGGQRYRWYDSLSSSTIRDTNASFTTPFLTANDTFYVASYNDTLEGPRTAVIAFVHALPSVSFTIPAAQDTVCTTTPAFTLTGGSPVGGSFSGAGVTSNSFDAAVAGVGTKIITYTYTDINSCSNTANQNIEVIICSPLALKLGGISVENSGGLNKINWYTRSEDIGTVFEVERSGDGQSFLKLASVQGKGASSYSYSDELALSKQNHYRIKMMMAGGDHSYSAVVTVVNNKSSLFSISAYPNPASNRLIIKRSDNMGHDALLQMTDAAGRLIRTQQFAGTETAIDISGLTPGVYLLKYTDGQRSDIIRININ